MNPSLSNPNYNLQVQGFQTPTVPTTMNATSLQTPTNVNLTPATPTTPVPNIQNIPTDTATPTQTNVTTQTTPANPLDQTSSAWKQAFDKVTGLFSSKQNQASDLATATQTAEAPYQQQLNEVNTQIKMQQANAISNQEKAANAGETSGYASREQQNIARTDAIETLKLSAIQAGLQGNIALAETQATNAINAKYADINKQIEDAKTNIYNNYDSFSASDKKKADQTLLRLDAQDAFAKQNQEQEKASAGIIQTAIQQGQQNGVPVPTLILQKAAKLTDPTEVTSLLAPYLKDAAKIQQQIDAHNTSIANQQKLNADIQAMNNPTGIVNQSGKPLTDAQNTSLGYAQRVAQSNQIIDTFGSDFAKENVQNIIGGKLPNVLQSSNRQQYEQAKSNFVNAVLRKESGAAISQSEYDNAIKQYFPVAGDSQAVIDQKKANRDIQYTNLLQDAGNPRGLGLPTTTNTTQTSKFDNLANDITTSGTTALLPRSVWTTVQDKDGLLSYIKSLGYDLKIQ